MSDTKDTSKCGYYYHPLGDLASAFTNGLADDSEWPHTYTKENKFHGIGNLDWGSGKNIPPNSKVYSMTNGTITNIFKNTSDTGYGFYIYIKTDRVDGDGKTIEIHYIELSGFSEKIATALGCKAGAMTLEEMLATPIVFNSSIEVSMGEHIGYTNSWYSNYSNMHTDFVYVGMGDNNSDGNVDVSTYPHATESKLSNNFKLTDLGNGIKKVECDGKIVGRENGYVREQYGGSSDTYKVWPHMSYMVCQQTPIFVTNGSGGGPEGGIRPTPDVEVPASEYLNLSFSDRYMGKYPESTTDMNSDDCRGLRTLTLAAQGEFGYGEEGLSYAKLFRAWILYYRPISSYIVSGYSIRENNSTLQGFARYWSNIVYNGWNGSSYQSTEYWNQTIKETNDNLTYMQNIYKNIAYPNIYGITKDYCIRACSNLPYSNETTSLGSSTPVTYGSPVIFQVVQPYNGVYYVMYRTKGMTQSFMEANPAVSN